MKRGNRRYLVLLLLIFALIGGYVAYWYVAMGKAQEAFAAAVAAERAAGNRFDYVSAEWGGFPIRIGVTLTDLAYEGRGVELGAKRVMAEVLPWNPTRALIRADGEVRLAARQPDRVEWLEFRPATLLASVRFTFSAAFEGADVELREVRSDGTDFDGNDFSFNAKRLQFDAVYKPTTDQPINVSSSDSMDLAFSADQLMISDGFAPALGPRIASIRLASTLVNLPLYAHHLSGRPGLDGGRLPELLVARFDFDWGGVSARGAGELRLDARAHPEGQLDFKITGLGKLIEALQANGTLQAPPGAASLPDVPGGTPISLQIKDGLVTFGGFPIGQLPALD